ncbi:cobaltochelatase subunit CobN [Salicola sp. Rm-C-2C1-2]|uniref:cobaltochelatase subunit CobN n=1 Tax=Salicola sp. Rm-C-2C1-2 TaxID=3141321 RepID=UPI0032E48B37
MKTHRRNKQSTNSRNWKCIVIVLCGLMFSTLTQAATIVGIVSDRSSAEMAAGAEKHLEAFPEHNIVLRTPKQLKALPDEEVVSLWEEADAMVLAAVFGEESGRIRRLVRDQGPGADVPIMAMNSKRGITRLARLDGEPVMDGLADKTINEMVSNPEPGEDPSVHLADQREAYPEQSEWLKGRAFYQGRSPEHMDGLFRWLLAQAGYDIEVPEPKPREPIRYYRDGEASADPDSLNLDDGPAVALLDLDSGDRPGDRDLLDAACEQLEERDIQCFTILARWGGASVEAVETLEERIKPATLSGIVSLQYFTVGGGDGREAVTAAFKDLDVPVIKGMRLSKMTKPEWLLSDEGLPWDSVHYQLAMPELQGISQPMVVAVAEPPRIDEETGVELTLTTPVSERVNALANRMDRWVTLQTKDNSDKRVALVYYNHPPGRQNIGADKLNVPESLFEILNRLKDAGYKTGKLPESPEALLDEIQDRGVNLPDQQSGLEELAGKVPSTSKETYLERFAELPKAVQAEMENGPVGYLHAQLKNAANNGHTKLGNDLLKNGVKDLRHMLRNYEHDATQRALDLLDQYQTGWRTVLRDETDSTDKVTKLRDALIQTGIPGLSGWGEAPGRSMVHEGEMLFPGIHFGNVFIGPQPPRGWEVSEELLHANTTFPPTHQYLGFYQWLRKDFNADALVYLGRHSTREFLPRRRAGLAEDDYPELLGKDLPLIYPYIVDGVGEGIQAKRRAMGVMVSHLTPPLETTKLYDNLLELRQLVETWESSNDPNSSARDRAVKELRKRLKELDMVQDIEKELAAGHHHGEETHGEEEEEGEEHADSEHHHEHAEGSKEPEGGEHAHGHDHDAGEEHGHEHHHEDEKTVHLEEVDDELLVHEVGHYLTTMQESFMPLGLHVFGRDWKQEGIDTMLNSMAGDDAEPQPEWREKLKASPGEEMDHLLAGLDGQFVPPGEGNDPVRTPEVLPTGRNFHALSSDLVPTRVAWSLGAEMAQDARNKGDPKAKGSEAIVLWASDTVRDEGVMIAFGLDMLGIKPKWNSRGIVEGLKRVPLEDRSRRRDALFTTSGLFRDLYEDQLVMLDQASRLALDGAYKTIMAKHPQLDRALETAMEPLPEAMRDPGNESLAENDVAARWVADTKAMMANGANAKKAGSDAALRVFGTAPGSYGAGVNRLADRSGAWDDRSKVADAYTRRMGYAFGGDKQGGRAAHDAFKDRLDNVGRTYLGRASHVYGLLDNDDGFDFQGGLSMAVEQETGETPNNRVLMHADPDNPRVESLQQALMSELRGQNLNPQWIKPLMEQGYAGARTMSADFLDNLWGWQVTSPDVVKSAVWDDINEVYFEDRHDLGLDKFLEKDHNVHVKTHMQAITLVAAHRGFWKPDEETLNKLRKEFAQLVVENGLPGSGHTRPDHPTMQWVAEQLSDAELKKDFKAVLDAARMEAPESGKAQPVSMREVSMKQKPQQQDAAEKAKQQAEEKKQGKQSEQTKDEQASAEGGQVLLPWFIGAGALVLLGGGVVAGRRIS